MAIMFHMIIAEVTTVLNRCEKTQADLINLLVEVNHGHMNQQLVDPDKLQAEMMKIKDQLPNGYKFSGWQKASFFSDVYRNMKDKAVM
jgi:hypothetical protein